MVNFSRTNSCDHDSFGISSKRILQEPCEDWIAIWNKRLQQKKNKKNISENPDDIFSRVHNVQSAYAASWHLVWQRGYYYYYYLWMKRGPSCTFSMNERRVGCNNIPQKWCKKFVKIPFIFFFFCKNGHFLLQNTLILDFVQNHQNTLEMALFFNFRSIVG